MMLSFLLVLAQALPSTAGTSGTHPARTHRHGHAAASPTPVPKVRMTAVNATCVPEISLSMTDSGHDASTSRGTNATVTYPRFPQGEWSNDGELPTNSLLCSVRDTGGTEIAGRLLQLKPGSSQVLLLTGDLSRTGPEDRLPQVGMPSGTPPLPWGPNFQFRIFPVEIGCTDPIHYRVVNAMPSKTLLLKSIAEGNRPSRQIALLAPGNSVLLTKQPPCVEWVAEIDGVPYPVSVRQEGAAANCLLPFFLKNGKPVFVRVFETPH